MVIMILIKLGGSVITDKAKKYYFQDDTTRRLAAEIKTGGGPESEYVIVHGAGSFGHIIAKSYKLHEGLKDPSQLEGIAKVQRDVKFLNLKVMDALIANKIDPVSIPPSSIVRNRNKLIDNIDTNVFRKYLDLHLTPVSFGDVVLDKELGVSICSGDQIMLHLARALKPEKAIFVADVDGIYTSNPNDDRNAKLLEVVDKECAANILSNSMTDQKMNYSISDVTGSMAEKVRLGLKIAELGVETIILNGNVQGRLENALQDTEVVCTKIRG